MKESFIDNIKSKLGFGARKSAETNIIMQQSTTSQSAHYDASLAEPMVTFPDGSQLPESKAGEIYHFRKRKEELNLPPDEGKIV